MTDEEKQAKEQRRSDIIRKLKKLRAKAESVKEVSTEAEANAFTDMIQKLLTEHKIDEAELTPEELEDLDPIVRISPDYRASGIKVRQKQIPWLIDLARLVAYGHYCELLTVPSSTHVVFVGRKNSAQTAADVYVGLVKVAEDLADKEYVNYFYKCKAEGKVENARGYRTSFLVGFCGRIGHRYFEYAQALEEYYASDKKALTVIRNSRREVRDWVVAQGIPTAKKSVQLPGATNAAGWKHGRSKADQIDLSGKKKLS